MSATCTGSMEYGILNTSLNTSWNVPSKWTCGQARSLRSSAKGGGPGSVGKAPVLGKSEIAGSTISFWGEGYH